MSSHHNKSYAIFHWCMGLIRRHSNVTFQRSFSKHILYVHHEFAVNYFSLLFWRKTQQNLGNNMKFFFSSWNWLRTIWHSLVSRGNWNSSISPERCLGWKTKVFVYSMQGWKKQLCLLQESNGSCSKEA